MPSIDCRQLAYVRGDRPVLEDISLQLPQGKLLALLGHNGAGKSTLIKLLLGLLKPAGGELKILAKPQVKAQCRWVICRRTSASTTICPWANC